jgi:hypothetical protein
MSNLLLGPTEIPEDKPALSPAFLLSGAAICVTGQSLRVDAD